MLLGHQRRCVIVSRRAIARIVAMTASCAVMHFKMCNRPHVTIVVVSLMALTVNDIASSLSLFPSSDGGGEGAVECT